MEITAGWGGVNIRIDNAGIAKTVSISDMPNELWHDTLETNVAGADNFCRFFLSAMKQARGAS